MNISDTELSWLAGLLEGEGSFLMIRSPKDGKIYHYPRVVVKMTDLDVIQRVARSFGTKVYVMPPDARGSHIQQQWRVGASGKRGAEIMRQLLPHMGERRSAKIEAILLAYETKSPLPTE